MEAGGGEKLYSKADGEKNGNSIEKSGAEPPAPSGGRAGKKNLGGEFASRETKKRSRKVQVATNSGKKNAKAQPRQRPH